MDLQKEREAFQECYKSSRDYKFYVKHEMSEKQIFEFKNGKYVVDCVNDAWKIWQAAKAHESKKLEGCVLVPHGVLDLTRFMCKTWSEIDKFVYKNCSDIGQYPVIQGTRNQLNLSRIGEQQINANEINKGVNWLLEAAREQAHD